MTKQKVKTKYNIINNMSDLKERDLTVNNAIKVNDNEYIVVLSAYELGEAFENEDVVYLSTTQRGTKIIRGQEKPISSEKNIKEMIELMQQDALAISFITLGIPENKLEYFNGSLNIKSQQFIIDGYHRVSSCYKLFQYYNITQDDDLFMTLCSTKFTILIGEYSEEKAKNIFSQYSKSLKLSKSRVESFNSRESSNRIVSKLNKSSFIKNKINETTNTINKTDKQHIWCFNSMNEAIKMAFGIISSEEEEKEIYTFLSVFFKELLNIYPELLSWENREISKQYSFICRNIFIYPLMSLAADLYLRRHTDWKEQMQKLKKINFDLESDIWSPIIRWNGNDPVVVNNKNTRQIFCKLVKQEFYKIQ